MRQMFFVHGAQKALSDRGSAPGLASTQYMVHSVYIYIVQCIKAAEAALHWQHRAHIASGQVQSLSWESRDL